MQIKSFYGDAGDNSLSELADFLVYLSNEKDIRPIQAKNAAYQKLMNADVDDDISDEKQNLPHMLPILRPKTSMIWMRNTCCSHVAVDIERKPDPQERAGSHILSAIGTPEKRSSWRAFQDNLTPILTKRKTGKSKSIQVLESKKTNCDETRYSVGPIEEGQVFSLDHLQQCLLQPKLLNKPQSIELDFE